MILKNHFLVQKQILDNKEKTHSPTAMVGLWFVLLLLHKEQDAFFCMMLACFTSPQAMQRSSVYFFLRRKICLRKSRICRAARKSTKMISVRYGLLGASVARSIMGKPRTMAGRFW